MKVLAILGDDTYQRLDWVRGFVANLKPDTMLLVDNGSVGHEAKIQAVKLGRPWVVLKPDWRRFRSDAEELCIVDIVRLADGLVVFGNLSMLPRLAIMHAQLRGIWLRVYDEAGKVDDEKYRENLKPRCIACKATETEKGKTLCQQCLFLATERAIRRDAEREAAKAEAQRAEAAAAASPRRQRRRRKPENDRFRV